MANYATSNIRTVALVGQGGSGKTTLAEALLLATGAIKESGTVERGTTVSDFDPLEKAWQHSLRASILHLDTRDTRIHVRGDFLFGVEVLVREFEVVIPDRELPRADFLRLLPAQHREIVGAVSVARLAEEHFLRLGDIVVPLRRVRQHERVPVGRVLASDASAPGSIGKNSPV